MRFVCVHRSWALALAGACLLGSLAPQAVSAQPAGANAPAAEAPRALPKDLPLKRDPVGPAEGPPWVAFLVLLGIAAGAAVFVLRRRGATGLLQAFQGARSTPGIERVGSQPLTPHASVHAVRWGGEEILLGCTSTQVTVLARRPAAGETERAS